VLAFGEGEEGDTRISMMGSIGDEAGLEDEVLVRKRERGRTLFRGGARKKGRGGIEFFGGGPMNTIGGPGGEGLRSPERGNGKKSQGVNHERRGKTRGKPPGGMEKVKEVPKRKKGGG